MKQIIIFLIVCISVSYFLVSCSSEEVITTPVSTMSTAITSENTALLKEIDKLKKANEELTNENNSLKDQVSYLEKPIDQLSISPLLSNYGLVDLLLESYTKNSAVNIFPGKLQSIHTETTEEAIYFIFSIDRMAVNQNWDGPGSDSGRGYFLNPEEKYQDYKGRLGTLFMDKGYISFQAKQEDILSQYGKSGDYGIYNFYMIGDEIVFVGPDPGP